MLKILTSGMSQKQDMGMHIVEGRGEATKGCVAKLICKCALTHWDSVV